MAILDLQGMETERHGEKPPPVHISSLSLLLC